MEANELRVGNYFKWSQGYGIDTCDEDTMFEYLQLKEPIPLTEEWLLKFGFEKTKSITLKWQNEFIIKPNEKYAWHIGVVLGNYSNNNPNVGCVSIIHLEDEDVSAIPEDLINKEDWTEADEKRAETHTVPYLKWRQPIAYCISDVHQLQNLIFALTGEELKYYKPDNTKE